MYNLKKSIAYVQSRGVEKGKPLNTGVYVYKIMLAFEDGSTLLRSGDVTLLRQYIIVDFIKKKGYITCYSTDKKNNNLKNIK